MIATITGIFGLLSVLCYALIAHRIRHDHEQLWEHLYKPGHLYDPTDLGSQYLWGFIRSRKWFATGDRVLFILCLCNCLFAMLFLAFFAFAIYLAYVA